MYAPQYPIQPRKTDTATPHVHPPEQTLSEHENNENFKTYLAGRHLAYSAIIQETQEKLNNAKRIQERNPNDTALWAITEGQIEGLQEILQLLKNSKERNEPTQ